MIEATYTLTEDEYSEAMMRVMRIRDTGKFRKRQFDIIGFSLLAALIPAIPLYFRFEVRINVQYPPDLLLLSGGFELCLIWLLFDLITLRRPRRAIQKLFKQASQGQTNVHLRIDEPGWHDHTPGSSTTFVEWPAFACWTETDHLFIVLQRSLLFHMVPKRVLTAEQLEELRALVGEHVPAAPVV